MKETSVCLLVYAASTTLTVCQSQNNTNPKKTSGYTAARRNTLGSHIPHPYSADSADSTVDDSFMRDQQRMNSTASSMGNSGMGGGGR